MVYKLKLKKNIKIFMFCGMASGALRYNPEGRVFDY
jgi:hypothetical protein